MWVAATRKATLDPGFLFTFRPAANGPAAPGRSAVADRVRAEMFRNIGLADLLKPVDNARAKIAAGNRADETEQKPK